MRVLVLGASGLIGSTLMRVLGERLDWEVAGTVRDGSVTRLLPAGLTGRLLEGVDVEHPDALLGVLERVRPSVVINCVGVTKHRRGAEDALVAIPLNALMPHRLARMCKVLGSRLVHISTDCVFAGTKGGYSEDDVPDATDLYGKTKAMGEVNYPNTVTLRTSTIGHELRTRFGLLNWFLSQEGRCRGYTRAVFSGVPTVVLAQVIRDVVIPDPELEGIQHVAAEPISKYDLLELIAGVYKKTIDIVPDDRLVIDRSLDGTRFRDRTGYVAPNWDEMIRVMHSYG
jgi:dTDP-4-dehydrorhamnose reductase